MPRFLSAWFTRETNAGHVVASPNGHPSTRGARTTHAFQRAADRLEKDRDS